MHDEILFSHAAHAEARVTCGQCHPKAGTMAAGNFKPRMEKCLECHRKWKAANQCNKCHTDARYARPWITPG